MVDSIKLNQYFYIIGGITFVLSSDLHISDHTFNTAINYFRVDRGNEDKIIIRHHFALPNYYLKDLGEEKYSRTPWKIYQTEDGWHYLCFSPNNTSPFQISWFNHNYTSGDIFHENPDRFLQGNAHSLTFFPTDQILLCQILSDREGFLLHSSGIVINRHGLLFIGHSGAGKSTILKLIRSQGEILCDDRMIIRRKSEGFHIFGTWSHGELPDVSPNSAPLRAVLFLEKANTNELIPLSHNETARRLPLYLIKPFVTQEWWEKTLDVVERFSIEVPAYLLRFDKSGRVNELIGRLLE